MRLGRIFRQALLAGLAIIGAWILVLLSQRADVALQSREVARAAADTPSDRLTTQRTDQRMLVRFDRGMRPTALADGWSGSEPNFGTWSQGTHALLRLKGLPPGSVRVTFQLAPFIAPGAPVQRVKVKAQDQLVADWRLTKPESQTLTLDVPADAREGDGALALAFQLPDADSPARQIPGSKDARVLAIKLEQLEAVTQP
jgi:hypothetical protein